jgi:hypothetical protein
MQIGIEPRDCKAPLGDGALRDQTDDAGCTDLAYFQDSIHQLSRPFRKLLNGAPFLYAEPPCLCAVFWACPECCLSVNHFSHTRCN